MSIFGDGPTPQEKYAMYGSAYTSGGVYNPKPENSDLGINNAMNSFVDPNATGSGMSGGGGASFGGLTSLLNIFDPSQSRLQVAKLLPGGMNSQQTSGATNVIVNTAASTARSKDWRVSITLADPKLFGIVKGQAGSIQSILADNGGVIFPYVPQISVQNSARYSEQQLTHSNYKNYFYEGSDVSPITISGDFTVQNIAEGQYLLAALYFFRSTTKMFFGGQANTGNPPPLVKLNGYGQAYFPNVTCVVTTFTHTMTPEVDYLEIPLPRTQPTAAVPTSAGRQTVRLPTVSNLSVTVQPVYSRKKVHDSFDLGKFARGDLINNGFL
jgi:hypothetical protein